jgi:diadenosine tetraphosphate (Ap4A) HIT family hydrolase
VAPPPRAWPDDLSSLHPPVGGSLPGTVWLASKSHVDSFRDLRPVAAQDFGLVVGAIEPAIYSLGNVGRLHLYRWGDGGAHFHVWFLPRPLGMLKACNMTLPLWEDVLPKVPDEEMRAAAKQVAAALEEEHPSKGC